jgi:pimeloyl-ACP methyl ester carboxylesterase
VDAGVLGWIVVLAGAVVGVPAAMYLMQDSMLFFPQPLAGPPPASRPARPVEELVFDTADGPRLRGWLVGAATGPAPLVVYYGGNAEEVSWQAREPGWPADRALALVNYRGYGGSEGKPSERSLFADALLVFDALARRPDVDGSRVVLFGRSLGSAVAVHVAAERPVAGVILVSPFESMIEVGRRHYPWLPVGLLLRHPFDAAARAPAVRVPLLAIVAEQDTIIPPVHSKRLFDAWGGPRRWVAVPHADHNDVAGAPEFWAAVTGFLREGK